MTFLFPQLISANRNSAHDQVNLAVPSGETLPTTNTGHLTARPRRVAVCFFGLTRSLPWTLPSIQKRLFGVLRDKTDVDVFVHTYHLLKYENRWSGEMDIEYGSHAKDYRVLNATRSSVTNQDDFDLAWPDPKSLTQYSWEYDMYPDISPR